MANNEFVFKQFKIIQDKCAMKVGTDAVLLGAWVDINNTKNVLDIGTGTGIIALMIAQKSNATIDAIDIDVNAFEQACENVKNSKWNSRIHVYKTSLQLYVQQCNIKYDLIVSNPPYFVDSSKASEESRTNARHTDQLPFEKLLQGVLTLLSLNGSFCVILPIKESQQFIELAEKQQLYLTKLTKVFTRTDKPEKRYLMKFERTNKILQEDSIIIEEDERHNYSDAYKALTKDYYLMF